MAEERVMPDAGNIVLALTDDDLGVEGHVEVDHRSANIDGGASEYDLEVAIADIPKEQPVSIEGRVEAERNAAQALADAVEKTKQERRDVYNSLFADDDGAPIVVGKASASDGQANIVLALTDDELGIEGHVEVDHRSANIGGGASEYDLEGAIADIPKEQPVSIEGRVEAERDAAQALADAVEKTKQERRDVYNSLFADDDGASTTRIDTTAETDGPANIVLALTDDDLGVEGHVEVDHRSANIDGGASEYDLEVAIADIPKEQPVSIEGRVEAERNAAQDLADAVEKTKQDRRDVYNSLFADDDGASIVVGKASEIDGQANIVLALTDDDLGIEGQVEVDHRSANIDGGASEYDLEVAIADIPNEQPVSIEGRVEAERDAAQALADAVEKTKQERRDVYNSLFADDDGAQIVVGKASATDVKVSDQRIDLKREENLKTTESSEQSSPVPAKATSSKALPAKVIRTKPCQTEVTKKSQWCKKDVKEKDLAGAEKPLPDRNYCCSKEFTEVQSQDFAKSGKDKQNQAATSKKQEPSPRIRCPKKKKSSKPPLPMTIMRLL